MQLVITLRKEVSGQTEGQLIFELVKERLKDRSDIEVHGHVTNHFEIEEPES